MGLRFQKRIRLFKGFSINFSKTGRSLSTGGRGATVNISKRGTKTTVGLPGTGVSYSRLHKNSETNTHPEAGYVPTIGTEQEEPVLEQTSSTPGILWIFILLL